MGASTSSSIIPPGTVGIVAHDAGGAEILASWVEKTGKNFVPILEGPAKDIFEAKNLGSRQEYTVIESLSHVDWVLTGTSWGSELEYEAIGFCNKSDKYVVAYLDHWTNYRERFVRRAVTHLPNEIWVADEHALSIANTEFPEVGKIRLAGNPYLEAACAQIKRLSKQRSLRLDEKSVLYLCENTSHHSLRYHGSPDYWGYTETDAIRFFLDSIDRLGINNIARITVRPHPSECVQKYHFLYSDYPSLPIEVTRTNSMMFEIARHWWVIGCNTMGMVVALMNGNKVLTCVPPAGRPCVLPFEGIQAI